MKDKTPKQKIQRKKATVKGEQKTNLRNKNKINVNVKINTTRAPVNRKTNTKPTNSVGSTELSKPTDPFIQNLLRQSYLPNAIQPPTTFVAPPAPPPTIITPNPPTSALSGPDLMKLVEHLGSREDKLLGYTALGGGYLDYKPGSSFESSFLSMPPIIEIPPTPVSKDSKDSSTEGGVSPEEGGPSEPIVLAPDKFLPYDTFRFSFARIFKEVSTPVAERYQTLFREAFGTAAKNSLSDHDIIMNALNEIRSRKPDAYKDFASKPENKASKKVLKFIIANKD